MLPLLLACAFVQPAPTPVELEPSAEVLARIDTTRNRLQATDAGVELWRTVDAHGGLLRYERVGPLTARLVDGTVVAPGHPDHGRLTAPFSLVGGAYDVSPTYANDGVHVQGPDGELLLDATSRRLLRHGEGEVRGTMRVQGLTLVRELALPDRTLAVEEWSAADPISGL